MTALADQVSRRLLHRYQGAPPTITTTELLAGVAATLLAGAAITYHVRSRK